MVKISQKCQTRMATAHDTHLTWCSGCRRVFCDTCYETQAVHDPDDPSDVAHEKTCLGLAELILSITSPEGDCHEQHVQNLQTKWFGVMNDEISGKPHFHDFGRFYRLVGGSVMGPNEQFPCLISFVGATGSGKSTVVNALVKLQGNTNNNATVTLTPVIGSSANLDSPTSGDVHLFADMESYNTQRPLFYIDCEGLGGGNNPPISVRYMKDKSKSLAKGVRHPKGKEIIYANDKQRTRKWAVEKLYPRILFPFSDVICYVTRNFRNIEEQIQQMLYWADRVFEKSVNQPILPVGVIVVNALEFNEKDVPHGVDWWNVESTTTNTLKKYRGLVWSDGTPSRHSIPELAGQWRMNGREIPSLAHLISCYFSDFKIICIPAAKLYPPSLIKQQYEKLRRLNNMASNIFWQKRKELGLLMSAEELEHYLEYAFDHFSQNPKAPFNFLDAALFHKPVPDTFKSHICKLAVHFMSSHPDLNGEQIFTQIARLVASSIFLDAYRRRYPGRGVDAEIFESYRAYCEEAQTEFYQRHWPCEARSKKGKVRCVNVASGHGKGHQKPNGKVFAAGDFQSSFGFNPKEEQNKFSDSIRSTLCKLNDILRQTQELVEPEGSHNEERAAAEIHLKHTLAHFANAGTFDLDGTNPPLSQGTCFCCLSSSPQHTLYCGHIICQRCLENYSFLSDDEFYRCLKACPLCNKATDSLWKTKVRPSTAGLRILSLDGGGIRSIIQLTVLKELERVIGLDLPIQDFFDLIIGTSGGGIVAFGIGVKRLSVDECITIFKRLAEQAFTKRYGVTWPAFGTLIEARHHSVYKTSGLENALQETFGNDHLYGSKPEVGSSHFLNVGVTATSSSNAPYLLANYNRPVPASESSAPYIFFRAENPSSELKLWEALRATSAAPTYFKSFYHEPTRLTFNDGGIKYNNPIFLADKERKTLWPSLAKQDPDILLSIGTGFDTSMKGSRIDPGPVAAAGVEGFLRRMFDIALDAIHDNMDTEKTWEDFAARLHKPDDFITKMKYRRLNLNLTNSLPKLDDVDLMDSLQIKMRETFLQSPRIYESIADTLIASLFYFEMKTATPSMNGPGRDCTGTIKCRLQSGSPPLMTLYSRLRTREFNQGKQRKSVFLISNDGPEERDKLHYRTLDSISRDIFENKPFQLEVYFTLYDKETSIYISLSGDYSRDVLISGFPRNLLHDDVTVESRLRRKSSGSSGSSTV